MWRGILSFSSYKVEKKKKKNYEHPWESVLQAANIYFLKTVNIVNVIDLTM